MSTKYVKLNRKIVTYRLGGKLYEANKVYAVDEELAETLLDKVDDKGNNYFKPARKSEEANAIKATRSDGRTSLRSQAPLNVDADEEDADDEEEEEDEGDDEGTLGEGQGDLTAADVAPKPAAKKATTKKAAKKTVRLSGGKVTPAADADEDEEDGDEGVQV